MESGELIDKLIKDLSSLNIHRIHLCLDLPVMTYCAKSDAGSLLSVLQLPLIIVELLP